MIESQKLVARFMKAFGQPTSKGFSDRKNILLGSSLILEEAKETAEAVRDFLLKDSEENRAHIVKELTDVAFVACWLAAHIGVDLDAAFLRVWESNMSKLDSNGKPIYREDGKVLKGPDYHEPILTDIVRAIPKEL